MLFLDVKNCKKVQNPKDCVPQNVLFLTFKFAQRPSSQPSPLGFFRLRAFLYTRNATYGRVEIARAQLPGAFQKLANMDDIREKMREAESEAFGVIVNSFHELEPGYAEAYSKAIKKKAWFVGPVSLCNDRMVDLFDRGNNCNN